MRSGLSCWTLDIDPEAAQWGMPGQHVIGDVQHVHAIFPTADFDVTIMNGVFGFGIDAVDQMDRSVEAVAHIMKPGGLFILGWNSDRISDPQNLVSIKRNFRSIDTLAFPKRKTFPSSTHVYDFYVKIP